METTQTWKIGDAIKLMKKLDNESVDMVFADPPFNVGKNYGITTNDNRLDYFDWCGQWIFECFRILKPTGSFYHMNLTKNLGKLMPIMEKYGTLRNLIIWKNVCSWGSKKQFYFKYQPIMLYSKTDDFKFNTYAQREKPFKRWGNMSGKMQGQMGDLWLDIPFVWAGSTHHPEAILKPNSNSKLHPTQAPIALIERCIMFSTDEGDLCCDPFLGSGTTLEACRRTNRNCIGYEISNEWEHLYPKRCLADIPSLTSYFEEEE